MKSSLSFLFLFIISIYAQQNAFQLWINNTEMISSNDHVNIFTAGMLNQDYSDETFNNGLNCRNGNLQIINNTKGHHLLLEYSNTQPISPTEIQITVQPNQEPFPYIKIVNSTHIYLSLNCSCNGGDIQCSKNNYYNKVNVNIREYSFSFLLNCDPDTRHKSFQFGYMLISLISSAIIIGVAMHSHIWSLKINLKPLRIELTWKIFLLFTLSAQVVILFAFLLSQNELINIFNAIRQIGIAYSSIFVFICFNEGFYLIKKLRRVVYKVIRICDVMSILCTVAAITTAFYVENWIYYDVLVGCICIGSIKLFHFNSLKQAISAITIMVLSVFTLVTIMHFTLPRSYNDYAGQLSSPFVLQVPDLINNLYKKCSWLSNTDIVIPGVMLSYLRLYDQNKSSRFGGVYTISGNVTFVLSTLLWMTLQLVYPFTVPFSLIVNSFLILVIFIIAYRRNEWKTIYNGTFEQGYNIINHASLQQSRMSFSQHIPKDILNQTLLEQQEVNRNSIN